MAGAEEDIDDAPTAAPFVDLRDAPASSLRTSRRRSGVALQDPVDRTVVPRSVVEELLRREVSSAPLVDPGATSLTAVSWVLVGAWTGIAAAVLAISVLERAGGVGSRVAGFLGLVAMIVTGGLVVWARVPTARVRGLALLAPLAVPAALSAAVGVRAGRALSLLGHDNLYHFGAMRSFLVAGPVADPVADVPAQLHLALARGGSLASSCTLDSARCQIVWYLHAQTWLAGLAIATVLALGHELARHAVVGPRRGTKPVLAGIAVCATAGWFAWLWWLGTWPFLVALGVLAAALLVVGDVRRTGGAAPLSVSLLPAVMIFAWPLLVVLAAPVAVMLVARTRHGRMVRSLLLVPVAAGVVLSTGNHRAGRGLSSLESPWASGLGVPEYRLLVLAAIALVLRVASGRRRGGVVRAWWREADVVVAFAGLAVACGMGLELVVELFGEQRGDYYGGKLALVGFVLAVVALVPLACARERAGTRTLPATALAASARVGLVASLALGAGWVAFPWGVPDYAIPLVGSGRGGIALAPAVRPMLRGLDHAGHAPIDGPAVLAAYDTVRDCPGAGPERLPLAWDGAARTDGTAQYAMYWIASLSGRADWWEMSRRINVPYDAKALADAAALHKVEIVAIDPDRTSPTVTGGFVLTGPDDAYGRLCTQRS